MTSTTYLTTAGYAARVRQSQTTVRRRAAAGEIPGAVRVSGDRGAWRFPTPCSCGKPSAHLTADPDSPDWACRVNDSTPPSDAGRGVSAESTVGPDDIMSGPVTQFLPIVMRVCERLDLVKSRPSRALKAVLITAASAAARHYPNRDGWCAACSWAWPCVDAKASHDMIARAASIILDGAA